MAIPILTILGYAAVDAINPCELAVLTLILVTILTQYPDKRRKVLHAGLAYTFAIFITYFIYGLIIIQFFRVIGETFAAASLYLYAILGLGAIVLGVLNLKDYIKYKPGGVATEMPVSWRPRMRQIVTGVTSTKGAFIVGILVTLFLVPCTMGPYVITGGILAEMPLLATIPWLLLYNFVFVLPMLAITVAVYAGFTTVEKTSQWKETNVRKLHLATGLIMIILGIYLVAHSFGLV